MHALLLLAQPVAVPGPWPPWWHGMLAWVLWTLFVATAFHRHGVRDAQKEYWKGRQDGAHYGYSFHTYPDGSLSWFDCKEHGISPEQWCAWTGEQKWVFAEAHFVCPPGKCRSPGACEARKPEAIRKSKLPKTLRGVIRMLLLDFLSAD